MSAEVAHDHGGTSAPTIAVSSMWTDGRYASPPVRIEPVRVQVILTTASCGYISFSSLHSGPLVDWGLVHDWKLPWDEVELLRPPPKMLPLVPANVRQDQFKGLMIISRWAREKGINNSKLSAS